MALELRLASNVMESVLEQSVSEASPVVMLAMGVDPASTVMVTTFEMCMLVGNIHSEPLNSYLANLR